MKSRQRRKITAKENHQRKTPAEKLPAKKKPPEKKHHQRKNISRENSPAEKNHQTINTIKGKTSAEKNHLVSKGKAPMKNHQQRKNTSNLRRKFIHNNSSKQATFSSYRQPCWKLPAAALCGYYVMVFKGFLLSRPQCLLWLTFPDAKRRGRERNKVKNGQNTVNHS